MLRIIWGRPTAGAHKGRLGWWRMRSAVFRAGLGFPFPENGSPLDIRRRIGRWATLAPTTSHFPWHLAKHLYRVLCLAEASFFYAECVLFCCREAARRALHPLNPGYKRLLLAAIIKHRIEFAAIYYEHLRYRVKEYLLNHGLDQWPECEGVSPLGYGPSLLPRKEIEANRRDLVALIEGTSRWYERTLAIIATRKTLDGRASGHELHHWVSGAGMPDPIDVPVTVEEEGGALLIAPEKDDAFPLVQAGWDLPEYPVDPESLIFDATPMPAPTATPATAPAPATGLVAVPAPHIAASRMLQSGLLLSAGPLLDQMKPAERELANYLISYKHPDKRIPLSYAEIGRILNCSDESVRRYQRALEGRHPSLKRIIAAARSRNRKGANPAPGVSRDTLDAGSESR